MTTTGPEVLWEVVHPSCPLRAEPHFDAKVLGWKQRGNHISCSEITTDGWLKISDGRGWMLSDMQGLHGLGSLLQPRRGQEVDLAVDEPQPQGICCLEVTFAQVAARAFPSRDAIALCYRRKGELVFARSQNFAGWLRLAGEEGWMLAFAPEHGQLLQPREAKESVQVDLWSLCDLWSTVRRKKRMLTPADVKALKDAEEGTKIMAGMDYEHHVATGNAEPLVEDGLLTKEDLSRPEEWIRQRIFANSLLRMVKEEPPFCELCPPDFRLTPRPLPQELFKAKDLAEVKGQPPESREKAPKAPEPKAAGYNGRATGVDPPAFGFPDRRGAKGASMGQRDFFLGGASKGQGAAGVRNGRAGRQAKGKGGKGKGPFGKMPFGGFGPGMAGMGDMDMPGLGVMPVEVNGEEMLMTEAGLIVDPATQAPVGVLNPATGEVAEITEEHMQTLMQTLGQINMVELDGRPYLMMAGLLVDPQTQEVAFKVEPDGTVIDAATGEACGMIDVDNADNPDVIPTKTPPKTFKDENLDAHGWYERAKELMADDYYYQAAAAFGEALQCCQEERAVELEFECELLKGRASCWRKMKEFKSLLEDAEKLISYDADDQEALEWKRLAMDELGKARRR